MFSAIAVCMAFSNVNAQVVNGVRLSDLKSPYIEIKEFKPMLNDKVFIALEYGQKVTDERSHALIKDDYGKNLAFNSAVDCLNKMKSYGYELFQVYSQARETGIGNRVYILKKK